MRGLEYSSVWKNSGKKKFFFQVNTGCHSILSLLALNIKFNFLYLQITFYLLLSHGCLFAILSLLVVVFKTSVSRHIGGLWYNSKCTAINSLVVFMANVFHCNFLYKIFKENKGTNFMIKSLRLVNFKKNGHIKKKFFYESCSGVKLAQKP